jgi:hypothetical protein
VAELKWQEKEKAGKEYRPSKQDVAPHTMINWKSPVFWPIIERAALEQNGKPNIMDLLKKLKKIDPHFELLSHQQIGKWRDKPVKDRIEQPPETIATVKKEFLPGSHQTCYNVFVSF